jgi:Protein of unknown function (DUF3617)
MRSARRFPVSSVNRLPDAWWGLSLLSMGIALALVARPALAADPPQRKSGLWEMKQQIEGMPSMGAMQMCVDQASDHLMQERAGAKPDCSVMDVKQSGGKMTLHSVCKVDAKTTATTDAVFTGSMESSYRGDIRVRYSPPLQGRAEMKMVSEARWLGPCKPGQKPGAVVMPGMPANMPDMQKMMNDPKFQEMMKRQGGG